MVYYLNSKTVLGIFIAATTLLLGCKEDQVTKVEDSKEELVMYQPSEMANLMKAFYSYNETLKKAIESNEELPEMPEHFEAIHTAKMTDANGRTAIFESFAPLYLEAQKMVSDSLEGHQLRDQYIAAINLCISCHQTECVGPIPKIRKLVIQ